LLASAKPSIIIAVRLSRQGHLHGAPLKNGVHAGKLKNSPNKLSAVCSEDPTKEEIVIMNKPGVHELTVVTTSDEEGAAPDIDKALDAAPVLRALYTHVDKLIESLNVAAPFLELTSLYHLKVARLSCSDGGEGHGAAHPPAFAGAVAGGGYMFLMGGYAVAGDCMGLRVRV